LWANGIGLCRSTAYAYSCHCSQASPSNQLKLKVHDFSRTRPFLTGVKAAAVPYFRETASASSANIRLGITANS
jgi:hypothetical protein